MTQRPLPAVSSAKSFSAAILIPIVELAGEIGFPAPSILHGAALVPDDLQQDTRVSTKQVLRVLRNCVSVIATKDFAFQAGLRSRLSSYGVYGFSILSCSTFEVALHHIKKYYKAAYPLADLTFKRQGDKIVVSLYPFIPQVEDPALYRFYVDLRLGVLVSVARDLLGANFAPDDVLLTYEPDDAQALALALPDSDVRYNAAETQITLDASLLSNRIALANPVTHAALTKICDEMMEKYGRLDDYTTRIRKALLANRAHPIALNDICADLAVSPRTLRRKLRDEGTTYRDVVADLRTWLAIRYLRETTLSVEEIAGALGFSDGANLRRFLRNRTGKGPTAIRRDTPVFR